MDNLFVLLLKLYNNTVNDTRYKPSSFNLEFLVYPNPISMIMKIVQYVTIVVIRLAIPILQCIYTCDLVTCIFHVLLSYMIFRWITNYKYNNSHSPTTIIQYERY